MFGCEQAVEPFVARFEPDGDSWLFRSSLKAVPVRVSSAERDATISQFRRLYYIVLITSILGIVAAVGLWIILVPDADPEGPGLWMIMGIWIIALAAAMFWIMRIPDRAFRRRAPAGAALSPDAARKVGFGRLSYGQLAIVPVTGWIYVWSHRGRGTSPWAFRGWVTFAVALTGISLVQSFRKWWAERNDE